MSCNVQVNKLTETCWDKCVTDKPGSRLDGKTETCLSNCVERFLDTSLSISQRFATMLQKQMSQQEQPIPFYDILFDLGLSSEVVLETHSVEEAMTSIKN